MLDAHAVPLGIPSFAGMHEGSAARYFFVQVYPVLFPCVVHGATATASSCFVGTLAAGRDMAGHWQLTGAACMCAQVLTAEEASLPELQGGPACTASLNPPIGELMIEHLLGKSPYSRTFLGTFEGQRVAVKVGSFPRLHAGMPDGMLHPHSVESTESLVSIISHHAGDPDCDALCGVGGADREQQPAACEDD
jgi:hypothetical protein